MRSEEFEELRKTHIRVDALEREYSNPQALSDLELLRLVFDAANHAALYMHGQGIEELGKRLIGGKLNGCSAEAILALNLVAKTDDVCGGIPAKKALGQYYAREAREGVHKIELGMVMELLELEKDAQEPWQLSRLLDSIAKRALKNEIPLEFRPRLAKAMVGFLGHENEDVVFEAAFALKELKEPGSYPGILDKLKESPSNLSGNARRALRHAAENIAISVTEEVTITTRGYRGKDWNKRLFARMASHREMLLNLEKNVQPQEKRKVF